MNMLLRCPVAIKELGAFYTPQVTAQVLANWAIRSGRERVLEPSVGGGALLRAAVARAFEVNQTDRLSILGCDIDAEAIRALRKEFESIKFLTKDFLELRLREADKFDVVIANPPFTRNHSLERAHRTALRKRFQIEGSAGLWVHFILHSISFLRSGGRIASIVPASAAFTKYGRALVGRLCEQFASVRIVQFESRPVWGSKAEERGAALFAEGYREGVCDFEQSGLVLPSGGLEGAIAETFSQLIPKSVELGSIANLSIGAVTGRNKVFLLSERERKEFNLPLKWVLPVVSRARQLRGASISRKDLLELAQDGEKTWLLRPPKISGRMNPARKRLNAISVADRASTAWFQKRDPWWYVDVGPQCDAVFTYMNDRGPRIAFVDKGIACTNTLHKVTFKRGTSRRARDGALLSFYSSFGQLAAERMGRVYGGGVLKFELAEARLMPILVPLKPISLTVMRRINVALRDGMYDVATELADEVLLEPIFGNKWRSNAKKLLEEVNQRRKSRQLARTDAV